MSLSLMTVESQHLCDKWRDRSAGAWAKTTTEMVWEHRLSTKKSLHSCQMQTCFHIRNQYFKMSSGAHHMDNRFPPVEREAWIIFFVVNLSEAWNHTLRSMQKLLFQLQPKYVHGGLSFPQHTHKYFPLKTQFCPSIVIIEKKEEEEEKAVDYFNL